MTVIGNDGGLFATKKTLQSSDYLVLSPGERLDLIIDLTDVCPNGVSKLRLVNLAVASLVRNDAVEAIFQHEAAADGSIFRPVNQNDFNVLLAKNQANIMQFSIYHNSSHDNHCHGAFHALQVIISKKRFMAKLDRLLWEYAEDDGQEGFQWSGSSLEPVNNAAIIVNRMVVLMNNTKVLNTANPYTAEGKWHDTQIWEMGPVQSSDNLTPFQIPFDAKLGGTAVGNPVALKDYQVMRSTFFAPATQTELISKSNGGGFNQKYPPLATTTITPTESTYERWYVANLSNWQSADDDPNKQPLQSPDMHPFHMHLVNFVVLRRFVLNDNGDFNEVPKGQNNFDSEVRHDTVRINSNELLELLVYIPPGYSGKYPYHCHLVEHEDMGMMLHFEV